MANHKPLPIADEIALCTSLRDRLKEQGLEHAVRTMSVEERGYARRRFREALKSHIALLQREAQGVNNERSNSEPGQPVG